MKSKIKLLSDVPINIIIIPVLFVFMFQALISMFYKNNNLTFYSIHSFHSLAKADVMAASNWSNLGGNIPGLKEINGFMYPLFVSLLIKIVGKYNIIPVLYVISFFIFLLISIVFYKIASYYFENRYNIWATLIFIISAPIMLSSFSGGDIVLINLLFILDVYFIYFYVPLKDYKFAILFSFLLLQTNYTGVIYGLTSLFYIILSMNEKRLREDYNKKILMLFLFFILFCVIFSGYVFIEELSPDFFEKNVFFSNKTFFVNTFFKDGFLWSKLIPPFFSILFFISLYMRYIDEIKERKISFITFVLLVSIAAFFMELFAVFSEKTDTLFIITPFFFLLILSGLDGMFYVVEIINKKNSIFSKENLILGLILFFILYNIFWTFTFAVEKNNDIRYLHNNMYVERFFEK
ncbi:MAG: hypothetical protein N3E50_08625 [Candidatus Goldbacteria bacterium]|nr:hypothetical protein [Candidatus Goldiibacteriota bacterium]